VVEPDGYLGWPKLGASGTDIDNLDRLYADSLLGEAMVLRPVVQAAAVILRNPALASRHTGEAREYLRIARAVLPNGISVVLGVAPTMA